jgi:hypothetical protein
VILLLKVFSRSIFFSSVSNKKICLLYRKRFYEIVPEVSQEEKLKMTKAKIRYSTRKDANENKFTIILKQVDLTPLEERYKKIEQINKKESCNINIENNIVNSKITSDVEVKIEELSIKSTSILEKFLNYEV